MNNPLSTVEVTNGAIVIKRSDSELSPSLQRYQEVSKQSTDAYRESLYQTAARIRARLVASGKDVSVEEALRQASIQESGELVYITTLQQQNVSLREKLFGVTNG